MDSTLPRTNLPKSRQSLAHLPSTASSTDRENATADISALRRAAGAASTGDKKKSRGKSIGPGGIEALKESDGNATKIASASQVKSILKPTVPLTPPKAIPTFDELRKRSTGKKKSPAKNGAEDLLIDFSTPGPSRNSAESNVSVAGSANVVDPFSPITRASPKGRTVAVRTEQEQEDAVRDREAESRRQSEKQAILDQRAARRKSMANRRVSFAPEATLHTWSVMELAEDSTTSSASNSTRRQSSMTAAPSPAPQDPPSTPPEQVDEPLVKASPAHQRDVHQAKRRRRSSGFPAEFDPSNEAFSSSPSGDISAEGSPARIEDSIHSDDDSDEDSDTAMSMDNTANTLASVGSSSTQSSLDERLRRAASVAGTRGIEYDEHGEDLPMELATGEITNAFQPWVNRKVQEPAEDLSAMQDQENINPFSPAFKAQTFATHSPETAGEDEETQDMTMDETRAVGGIVSKRASPGKGRRKSVAAPRRRSSVGRRKSLSDDSVADEETMDFTTVAGGIIQSGRAEETSTIENDAGDVSDEDLTMEFTNVLGGVLNKPPADRRESIRSPADADDNETMDMTVAVGGILPAIEEQTEPLTDVEDDTTSAMDMTRAVGAILPSQLRSGASAVVKKMMQEETDGQKPSNPVHAKELQQTSEPNTPSAVSKNATTSVVSETGSPSLGMKQRLSGRKSAGPSRSTTPKSTPIRLTPSKQSTPTKQITPLPSRAETPNKTPIMSSVAHRGASPKKLFKAEIKAQKASPASKQMSAAKSRNGLFDFDERTGHHTPSVVLHAPKPHQHLRRRSSGIGIDKDGIGSPRVTELLSRRTSIGEAASTFVPKGTENKVLRFDDPKTMEVEVNADRAEEERRESGRFVMEQEANEEQDENVTFQLREMIESMTPKKSGPGKLKGRKSLAVGAARGLLGKRPAELDMDEEDDGDTTPKRLKMVSNDASPMKSIHLPKPPTQIETTGRLTRAQQHGLEALGNTGNSTPTILRSQKKNSRPNSPQHTGRFKDVTSGNAEARPSSFEDRLDNVMDAVDVSTARIANSDVNVAETEKVSLQSFLNMTNIHFIELSTTKRRHTMAPNAPLRSSEEGSEATLESCFAAAATTVPLLELYQHATRELKSYISSGRKIIRSIEAETLAEQPPLFREYLDARPEVKMVMDNQFRNGKSNARLQSKDGWYAWRSQLVDGLRGGLESIKQGMQQDLMQVGEQEHVLNNIVPRINTQHSQLEQDIAVLEESAAAFKAVDQEALVAKREHLKTADNQYHEKTALLAQLQRQMKDKEEALGAAAELKTEMKDQIAEADRVREECRGWSGKDVLALKSKVSKIEETSGWSLVTAEEDLEEPNDFGVALTMAYKGTLRLFFYPRAYQTLSNRRRRSGRRSRSNSGPTAPVSLLYSPKAIDEGTSSPPLPTEQRFFLQLVRSQLHAFAMMPRGSITAKTLLDTVASGWDLASKITNEIRMLNMAGITTVAIVGDEHLSTKLMLMLDGKGRIDFEFVLSITVEIDGRPTASTAIRANAVYGSVTKLLTSQKTKKVQQALGKEVETKELGTGAWIRAIKGFEYWLHSQQAAVSKPQAPTQSAIPLAEKQPAQPPAPVANLPSTTPLPTTTTSTSTAKIRSPLAAKKTNTIQKKSIPVPLQQQPRPEKAVQQQHQPQQQHREKEREREKENIPPPPPPTTTPKQAARAHTPPDEDLAGAVIGTTFKPAIAPEVQEQMMHTPIKRVGALRRSPLAGV